MSAKLTPEDIEKRKQHVIETLARNPDLTKHHFQRKWSYQYPFLNALEADGVVFGKPKKPYVGWRIKP